MCHVTYNSLTALNVSLFTFFLFLTPFVDCHPLVGVLATKKTNNKQNKLENSNTGQELYSKLAVTWL